MRDIMRLKFSKPSWFFVACLVSGFLWAFVYDTLCWYYD